MKRFLTILFALLLGTAAYTAEQEKANLVQLREQIAIFESVLNEHLNQSFPGPFAYLDKARGAYLPGYGLIFTFEVSLTRPASLFEAQPSDKVRREEQQQRRAAAKELAQKVLADFGHALTSLSAADSVSIVVHTLAVTTQGLEKGTMVVRAQKRDIDQLRANTISRDAFLHRLEVLEY